MASEENIPACFSIDMEAFRAGDEPAFREMFRHFYAPILFFTERMVTNHFTAEEITEDSFIMLWQRHADFEDIQKMKAFLYISAKNHCLNYISKNMVI